MGNIQPILKQLFAAYANSQVTPATIAVYVRLLADIPPADLQVVVDQCLAECKFLPAIAEIRERYALLTRTIAQPTAAEAWGEVLVEIRRVGYVGSPYFADSAIAQVVRQMGWRELCMSETPGVDRAQFMRMYEQLQARGEQIERLLPQSRRLAARCAQTRGLLPLSTLLPIPKKSHDD